MHEDNRGAGWNGRTVSWRFFPMSDEPLWHKLAENRAQLDDLEDDHLPSDEQPPDDEHGARAQLFTQCRRTLDDVETLLRRRPRWSTTDALMAYRLLHQVDHDIILLTPPEKLGPAALNIRDDFERNIDDPWMINSWSRSGLLSSIAERYLPPIRTATGAAPPEGPRRVPPAQVRRDRELLRAALAAVDQNVDRRFRQLAMNYRIQEWSTLLLVGLIAITYATQRHLFTGPMDGEHLAGIGATIGAAGAILSNMLRTSPFNVPFGQTFQAFAYYLLVVPIIGAAAGLFMVALESSRMFFAVTTSPLSFWPQHPPIVIRVGSNAAAAVTRIVIAAAAGFFGDRALRTTMGSVFDRLFGGASKETAGPAAP